MSQERPRPYEKVLDVDAVAGVAAILHDWAGKSWPSSVVQALVKVRRMEDVPFDDNGQRIWMAVQYEKLLRSIDDTEQIRENGPKPYPSPDLLAAWEPDLIGQAESIVEYNGKQLEQVRFLDADSSGVSLLKLLVMRQVLTLHETRSLVESGAIMTIEDIKSNPDRLDFKSLSYYLAYEDFTAVMEQYPSPPTLKIEE